MLMGFELSDDEYIHTISDVFVFVFCFFVTGVVKDGGGNNSSFMNLLDT